jgi:hypothetical protein
MQIYEQQISLFVMPNENRRNVDYTQEVRRKMQPKISKIIFKNFNTMEMIFRKAYVLAAKPYRSVKHSFKTTALYQRYALFQSILKQNSIYGPQEILI